MLSKYLLDGQVAEWKVDRWWIGGHGRVDG